MRRINEFYISILRIELKDLQEDIEVLIEKCTEERERGNLTNYVFMENLALFKNELLGVDAFGRILDETDPKAYDALDEMVEELKQKFQAKVKASGLAEAINVYVERKLREVARYVTQKSEP